MKAGWEESKIEELCFIGDGNHSSNYPTKEEMIADGVPFIRSTNIGNGIVTNFDIKFISKEKHIKLKKGHLKTGDVLITNRGEIGKTAIVDSRFDGANLNSQIAWLRCNESIFNRYLFYFLNSNIVQQHFKNSKSGAALQQFTIKQIKELKIAHPNYVEQQRIVAILDQAFEGIAKARTNAEQNLQNARALFESHLQSVFTQRDEGWVRFENALSDLCELIVDCEHKTAPTQEIGIASIRTPNIGKGELLLDGVYRVSDETYKEWTRRAEPQSGDLILAREAPAGNLAVIPENTKLCLGQRTVLIRPNTEIFIAEFLCFYLLQPEMQSKLLAHSRGATVQHVNMKDIRALMIGSLPNLEMQKLIAINIKTTKEKSQRLEALYQRKITLLDELKKSLLQQAFAGEL